MSSVDTRVVEMKIDNKQFLDGVSTSLDSLNKLKTGMNMDSAAKNLSSIDGAIQKVDFSGMANAIQNISNMFTPMGMLGVKALSMIEDKVLGVINTAIGLAKSMSIDQISAGYDKYTTKMKSVQTIMSATGKSVDEVNGQLNKLNQFTDETSYNFSDMTENIGKFTAVGVDLDTATKAMQGIAEWGASAGVGVEGVSRAMYNLSQSMGVGHVQLMDWRSVENASMGTKEFKEQVIETAKAMGTLTAEGKTAKGTLVDVGTFDSTLEEKWFSSDVLLSVLNNYNSFFDQVQKAATDSGMTITEVLGKLDKENGQYTADAQEFAAKYGITLGTIGEKAFRAAQETKSFSEAIAATQDAVSTGWMKTFENIFGNKEEATAMWTALTEVLYDVFAASGEARNELLKLWHDMGGRDKMIEGIANAWKAVVSIMTPVQEAFKQIFPPMTAEKLYDITAAFANFTKTLEATKGEQSIIGVVFSNIFSIVSSFYNGFKEIASRIGQAWQEVFPPQTDGSFLEWIGRIFMKITNAAKQFVDSMKLSTSGMIWFKEILKAAFNVLKIFGDAIGWLTDGYVRPMGETFGGLIKNVFERLLQILGPLASKFNDFAKSFDFSSWASNVKILQAMKDGLEKIRDIKLNIPDWLSLSNIFGKIGSMNEKLIAGLGKVKEVVGQLGKFIADTIKSSIGGANGGVDLMKIINIINGGLGIAGAAGMFKAIKAIKDFFDKGSIAKSIKGISESISGVFDSLGKAIANFKKQTKADELLKIAKAIALLAASLFILASIDPAKLASGLAGMAGALAEFAGFMKGMDKMFGGKQTKKGVTSLNDAVKPMIKIAAAIMVLAIALKIFSSIDPPRVASGLVAMGGALVEFAYFMKAVEKVDSSDAIKSMTKMAWAMIPLAVAMKIFASMSWEDIGQALLAMGGALAEFVIVIKVMNKAAEDSSSSSEGISGIQKLAWAMIPLAVALKILGSMSWEDIGQALVAMGGALVEFAIIMDIMSNIGTGKGANTIDTSTNVIMKMSAAMLILAVALKIFGSMDYNSIGQALIAMGGGLFEFAFALTALSQVQNIQETATGILIMAAAMLILAPAMALLGALSWESIIKSLIAMGGALAIFVISVNALTAAVPVMLAFGGAVALLGVGVALIGVGMVALAAGLGALVTVISGGMTIIVGALTTIIQTIILFIPQLATALAQGIIQFVVTIGDGMVQIIDAVVKIGMGILDALDQLVPKIVEVVLDIITSVLNGIADHAPEILDAIGRILMAILHALIDYAPKILEGVGELIGAMIEGLANGIADVWNKAVEVGKNVLEGIGNGIGNLWDIGVNAVQGLIDGIGNMAGAVWDAATNIASNVVDGIKDFLGIHSPSKVLFGIGGYSDQGLINGLMSKAKEVYNASTSIGSMVNDGIQDSIDSSVGLLDSSMDPTITPVIDLSQVQSGVSQMNSMFGSRTIGLASTVAGAAPDAVSSKWGSGTTNNNTYSPNTSNTFNITNPDPKGVANEVDKILQQKVVRRSAEWA